VVKLPSLPRINKPPSLPKGFSSDAEAWWSTVWDSPMAAVYLEADVPALTRLASLIDQAAQGEVGAKLLGEIRQLEDRFGLSPLARRRLQWELEQANEQSSPVEPAGQEQRWLRAVSD
jgi:hypothetical protein